MQEIVENRSVTFTDRNGPDSITAEKLDLSSCYSDDEIVVEIHAASLNPVDTLLKSIAYSLIAGKTPKTYSRDYSGIIARAGKNVEGFSTGDKVMGLFSHTFGKQGSLTHYLILDPKKQDAITKMVEFNDEQHDDFIMNAAWPLVFLTASSVLSNYGQKWGPQSRILVIGASTSVSNAFVQIAKNHLKVGTVVGICSKKSFDHNKAVGFDHLIAYDEGTVTESVKDLMKEKLNNEKFDLIFDSVGNPSFFPSINDYLKPRSENSYYLAIAGESKMDYSAPSFMCLLPGFEIFKRYGPFKKYNYGHVQLGNSREGMELGVKLIASKKYKPTIDSVFGFEDYADAFKRLKSNKAKGKIVIKVI